eukprot:CAMPEP_0202966160 /NCGR_PEP_ID=MMETSP1396-20130829/10454_1 /ASSEMBLY_ACC=CAM_ASM_000872 /TAXON_ID= /ORGANISM="Pseudokeronopsis sp., Strain Brazil" /LENGTH=36 /DNA_ID= /DNA_START= /DNA_END= /DNA_ORIENTATION=
MNNRISSSSSRKVMAITGILTTHITITTTLWKESKK